MFDTSASPTSRSSCSIDTLFAAGRGSSRAGATPPPYAECAVGMALNAPSPRLYHIAIDGEPVIACRRGFLSSIGRIDRHIPRKHSIFPTIARVVSFLNHVCAVARKGQEAKHEAS
jgi:hypothetical protein